MLRLWLITHPEIPSFSSAALQMPNAQTMAEKAAPRPTPMGQWACSRATTHGPVGLLLTRLHQQHAYTSACTWPTAQNKHQGELYLH